MARALILVILLILPMIYYGSSRSIKENDHHLNVISAAMDEAMQSQVLELDGDRLRTTVTCEPIYSFLPCSSTLWGYLFLLVVYEVLLSLSQQYIANGSNLFFQMFGTGIFGASLFQVLGVFPQIILVIVIGVSGDSTTIESMAAMGFSLLAGTAIMMLTVGWGSVVAFGSYDISDTTTETTASASSNSDNKKPFSLIGYGVKTDMETKYTARIMLLSMIPILILQLAKILNSTTATRVLVLTSLIISFIFLISYLTYQIFEPWIQNRRLEFVLNKFVQKKLLRSLLADDGHPNISLIKDLFRKIDKNSNASVSTDELRALVLGIQVEEVGLDEEDFVEKVIEEFDISGDSNISEAEFVNGLSKWLNNANRSNKKKDSVDRSKLSSSGNSKKTGEENQSLLADQKQKKSSTTSSTDKPWWIYTKAAFLVILGTVITILLGAPLMETVDEFSTASNIPSFFVSYVVIPLALGYKQMLVVIKSAREKTEKASSLTFSELYGGVFMNNVMGLAIFLLLVYIRDLTWDVSAELLVVLIICTTMGILGSFSTKIPFWVCLVVYLLYPISLVLLYILTEVLGWS